MLGSGFKELIVANSNSLWTLKRYHQIFNPFFLSFLVVFITNVNQTTTPSSSSKTINHFDSFYTCVCLCSYRFKYKDKVIVWCIVCAWKNAAYGGPLVTHKLSHAHTPSTIKLSTWTKKNENMYISAFSSLISLDIEI